MEIISSPMTLHGILEAGFVQNVFLQGAPYSTAFDPQKSTDKAVVYLELFEIDLELIIEIKAAEKNVILFHMGDEFADKDLAAYSACDLIIQNYFFHEIINHSDCADKIFWVPNGCRTGVGPRAIDTLKKVDLRQYVSRFGGWFRNTVSFLGERSLFADAVSVSTGTHIRRAGNHSDLYLLSSNGFSNGGSVGLYSAAMEDSIFAPCPAGNSAETIRLADALECGCIPVTLEHEFINSEQALGEFGPPPFHLLESWDQFPSFLAQMREKRKTHPEEI